MNLKKKINLIVVFVFLLLNLFIHYFVANVIKINLDFEKSFEILLDLLAMISICLILYRKISKNENDINWVGGSFLLIISSILLFLFYLIIFYILSLKSADQIVQVFGYFFAISFVIAIVISSMKKKR
jgi:hypothetical protein